MKHDDANFLNRFSQWFFYAIGTLLLFRLIWQGAGFYYEELAQANYFLLLVVLKSLTLFVVMLMLGGKFLRQGYRRFLAFITAVGLCAAYQGFVTHRESQKAAAEWANAELALDELFNYFAYAEEKTVDPDQKYATDKYGVYRPGLILLHRLQTALHKTDEGFSLHFDRLFGRCFPPPNMLVNKGYRADCRAAYQDLPRILHDYRGHIELIYDRLETDAERLAYEDPAIGGDFRTFFLQNRESVLAAVSNEIALCNEMCQTGLALMDLLDQEEDLLWWDEGLVFFNHAQEGRFADLYYKMECLYRDLTEAKSESDRSLGKSPLPGLAFREAAREKVYGGCPTGFSGSGTHAGSGSRPDPVNGYVVF